MRALTHAEMQLLVSLLGFGFAAAMLVAGRLSGDAAVALVGAIVGYWMPSPVQPGGGPAERGTAGPGTQEASGDGA